ncbi:MFS transporter, partial [Chloroflexota bacterium]
MTIAMLLVVWSDTLWMFYFFSFVFGFGHGGIAPATNTLIGDVFGTRHIGVIMSVLNIAFSIGAAVGPVLAGYIFDISGSYYFAFIAGVAAAIITVILTLFLREPKAKMKEETVY